MKVLVLFSLILSSLIFTGKAEAAQTYDINTLSNINVRIDGASASQRLGDYNTATADLNQNGIPDLILSSFSTSYSGRTVSATYVIYDNILSALSSTGNILNLSDSSNWNLRYVGAVTGDTGSYYLAAVSDLSGNDKNDLILSHAYADHGGLTDRGAVYYIKDDLIDDYSGTGNTIDLATTTNFSTKYIGAAASVAFGASVGASQDFDNDGKNDLFITAERESNNSRANSGSGYILFNTLIDDYTGTGNVVSMTTSTNYNIRLDGAAAYNYLYSYLIPGSGDIDNDDKDDVMLSSPCADNAGSDNGSLYFIYNTILDDYVGTGNTLDLASTSKYNLRIDGTSDGQCNFGYSITNFVDIDNDNVNDLLIADSAASNNSRSLSGSVYILYSSLFGNLSGTGNSLDLASSSSYNVRFDGTSASSYFGYDTWALDFNDDGLTDIIAENCCSDNSVFVVYNALFSSLTGTGNTVDMVNSENYSFVILVQTIINSMLHLRTQI